MQCVSLCKFDNILLDLSYILWNYLILQLSYYLTANTKSSEAIEKLHSVILSVPMLAVDVRQEITEAQQLLHICKEHILSEWAYIV